MSDKIEPGKQNLVLAIVVSVALVFAFEYLFPRPEPAEAPATDEVSGSAAEAEAARVADFRKYELIDKEEALAGERIRFSNDNISGSIRLKGGRIDDVVLKNYRETADEDSPSVTLFAPALTERSFYADFGWTGAEEGLDLPDGKTAWMIEGNRNLAPGKPVKLVYRSDNGLIFVRTYSLDNDYMFTVRDDVTNESSSSIVLFNYGLIARGYKPEISVGVSHEGMTGFLNGKLEEVKYDELVDKGTLSYTTSGGWFGIADKYWMGMLALDKDMNNAAVRFSHHTVAERDMFQTDYLTQPIVVKAGGSHTVETRIFTGAKEVRTIDRYRNEGGIDRFDLSIDFGWYYFLTKPFIYILNFFYTLIGNMGWAIILFATLLRVVMYPVASKSYASMSKMKIVQPKIKALQDQYKNDKMRLQQEMMNLYKTEKINPAAGCLPILIQIPVFFSLYKVLYISIELRQAPFIGWITDLSLPDPTSVFTLFGLIPVDLPAILTIGVWPLLMGITMFIQQQLNPKPNDKTQAYVFMLLPVIFTFMLAQFAAGLVIYWTWSNILSIIQQRIIMKRVGGKKK